MKETQFCYPTIETWFICWSNIIIQELDTDKNSDTYNEMISVLTEDTEIKAYGSVLPTQCLNTPYDIVDYYTDKAEWLAILLDNGITPFTDTEN